ncbi:HAMP domain-containing histidine kinase [Eubacterium sp. MSJ-13]|uniref:sensor histidine kinase n=1 Tax=Eubacterium sp. MSJ-13 TaxID=2841513 RepID=UPI001C10EE66|nr:HAMP domain-containing sensor histidine kinase [Eubacterium sp. MSJ-13]MBU5478503.1 HAMP domain-containing histidine kinase [Eubacterium sp. MSJ-13]
MNFLRNSEIKKWGFINLLIVAAAAIVTYILSKKNTKVTAVVCVAGFIQFGVNVFFTKRRYDKLAGISDKIDAILHGNKHLSFEQYKEGELSVLSDEVEKLVIKLREQTERLQNDKIFLADSIADISHQIKTPLTSINLILNFLREEDITYERRIALVRELMTLAEKIKWQITALLRISRLDAGMVDFDIEDIDMGRAIDEAYSLIEIPLDIRGVSFERSYQKNSKVTADKEWLVEALGNILKNCMEHSFEGGKISVSCEENSIYSRIVISDNGTGIAKEDLPHIFERFYKGKSKNKSGETKNSGAVYEENGNLSGSSEIEYKSESVGIGLALSRSIITQFNGTIKVASEVGHGTSFDIRFYKAIV